MHGWKNGRPLALAAGMALLGCAGSTQHLIALYGPGEAFPNSVTDDENIKRSMAEGGQSDQPYVVDGTVQKLLPHSVLIEANEVGNRQVFVNRHTEITVDGQPAELAQLHPGMPIRAAYSLTGVARALQAGKNATPRDARQG